MNRHHLRPDDVFTAPAETTLPAALTGIRLPVYRAVTDADPFTEPPSYVTLVGICDRMKPGAEFEDVPDWCEAEPTPDALPVVAILAPLHHTDSAGPLIHSGVHLEAVTIDDGQRVHFGRVRFSGLLVGTLNRRWGRRMSARLDYPAPRAVQLWAHPR
ncbi:hypothetical protein [Nocardia noduli]|uniref:hypothetical protein n=1 Tax=Nocardia noduli TaxID=2815722 RepID=UPI001C21ABC8|nr:hypothetical protein [Nocardia noduli]